VAPLLHRDYVIVKIDTDRMKQGKRVAKGLRAGRDGGIPWYVILDPEQPLLRPKPTKDGSPPADDAPLQRRKVAVLATADGPDGNVGCPVRPSERAHFMDTLRQTRLSLSDDELEVIATALYEQAKAIGGDSADG